MNLVDYSSAVERVADELRGRFAKRTLARALAALHLAPGLGRGDGAEAMAAAGREACRAAEAVDVELARIEAGARRRADRHRAAAEALFKRAERAA